MKYCIFWDDCCIYDWYPSYYDIVFMLPAFVSECEPAAPLTSIIGYNQYKSSNQSIEEMTLDFF